MPTKGSGPADEWREIDRFDSGVGWIAYPEEDMQRASHALTTDNGVYVVDPVDCEGLDDLLAEFGDVAGVVLLLDRHKRDSATVARRHDVPVYLPASMRGVADDLDAETELVHDELGDSGYAIHELIDNRFWHEAVLYSDETGVLVVPEAVGTADFFRTGGHRLGVHLVLRLTPPKRLGQFDPERILVGHGAGVHEEAAAALSNALSGARRRAPRLYAKTARSFLPV